MLARILQGPVESLLAPDHLLTQPEAHYSTNYGASYAAPPPCATTAQLHDEKALFALLQLQHNGNAASELLHALQAYTTANMVYNQEASSSYSSYSGSPECSPLEHYTLAHAAMHFNPDEAALRKGKSRRGKRGSRGRKKNATHPEVPRAPIWAQGTAWNPRVHAHAHPGGSPAGTGVFIPGGATHNDQTDGHDEHFDCDLRELLGNLPEVWEY